MNTVVYSISNVHSVMVHMILYIKFLCLLSSLRSTLCVRFKSEVVACGVVYAAARRFKVPLPENPPWWKAFDADKDGIDEVCRVLAHLYSLPKAEYIPVCKDGDFFAFSMKSLDLQSKPASKVIDLFFLSICCSVPLESRIGRQYGLLPLFANRIAMLHLRALLTIFRTTNLKFLLVLSCANKLLIWQHFLIIFRRSHRVAPWLILTLMLPRPPHHLAIWNLVDPRAN